MHGLDIELRSLLRVLPVAHVSGGSAAAGLAHRHVDNIADRVQVGDDSLGDIDIGEIEHAAGEHSDLALGIVDLLLNGREDVAERHGGNAHQASALGHAGQEHGQMADEVGALGERLLCNRGDPQHGVEQLSVADRIQSEFVNGVGIGFVASLTELHDHLGDVEAAAADLFAASALQADVLDLVRTLLGDEEVGQDGSDTAGVDFGAGDVAAQKSEGRTYVKTCAAADAVVDLAEIGIRKDGAASGIIEDDRVEFFLFLGVGFFVRCDLGRARVHADIGCDALARAVTGKCFENIAGVGEALDELLDTEYIEMNIGQGADHTAVAFVGHGEDRTGLCHGDVGAGNAHFGMCELIAHDAAGCLDLLRDDGLVFDFCIFSEVFGDLLLVEVEGRHNHVDRCVAFKSNDELTEVGLLNQNAVVAQDMVHVNFFRRHGFGFNDGLDAFFFYEIADILHCLVGAVGMEDVAAPGCAVLCEFFDHLIDMLSRIALDFFDAVAGRLKIDACV